MGRPNRCNCFCDRGCQETVYTFAEINPEETYSPFSGIKQIVTDTGFLYQVEKSFPKSYFSFMISPPSIYLDKKLRYTIYLRSKSHDGDIVFKLEFDAYRLGDYTIPEGVYIYDPQMYIESSPLFDRWTSFGVISDPIEKRSSKINIWSNKDEYNIYRIYHPSSLTPALDMDAIHYKSFPFQITVRDSGILIKDMIYEHPNIYNNLLIDNIDNFDQFSDHYIFRVDNRDDYMWIHRDSGFFIDFDNEDRLFMSYSIDFVDSNNKNLTLYIDDKWNIQTSNIKNDIDGKNEECIFPFISFHNSYNYMTPLWDTEIGFDKNQGLVTKNQYYYSSTNSNISNINYEEGDSSIILAHRERYNFDGMFSSYSSWLSEIIKVGSKKNTYTNRIYKTTTEIISYDTKITLGINAWISLAVLKEGGLYLSPFDVVVYNPSYVGDVELSFDLDRIQDIGRVSSGGWTFPSANNPAATSPHVPYTGHGLNESQVRTLEPKLDSFNFILSFEKTIDKWFGEPPTVNIDIGDLVSVRDLNYNNRYDDFINLYGRTLVLTREIDSLSINTVDLPGGNIQPINKVSVLTVQLGHQTETFNPEDIKITLRPLNSAMGQPNA